MNESELKTALDELKQTPIKFNLVCALVECKFNITDALKKIGRSKGWFYDSNNTTPEEREYLIMLATEYNAATKMQAMDTISASTPHAGDVLVKLMDSRDERIKLAATTKVLEYGVGKPSENIRLAGKDGEVLEILVTYANSQTDAPSVSPEPTDNP